MHVFKADTVALTYPHTHTVSHTFHASITGVLRHSGDKITHILPERCYPGDDLAQGRDRAVRRFLDTDAEWLWTVDTDMGLPPITLDRLLYTAETINDDARVISALYNIAVEHGRTDYGAPARVFAQPMAGMWNQRGDGSAKAVRPEGVAKVDVVGAGCLLVHRSVYREFGPWYQITTAPDGHTRMGEDFSFCERLRLNGIPIWVDPAIPVVHHKDMWI